MSRLSDPEAKSGVEGGAEWRFWPIIRAVEYVEGHLHDVIRVADMADAAGYSIFHFCRCFNSIAKHSPYDYQMKRKLTHALDALQTADRSITQVAVDFGFETPDGFARAFKRMFRLLPSEILAGKSPDSRLKLPVLTERYLIEINRILAGVPSRKDLPDMELRGLTDRCFLVSESLRRNVFEDGVVVVDYVPHWETAGLQLLMGMDQSHPLYSSHLLRTSLSGGEYTCFPLNCPTDTIDSFLQYALTVFYRKSRVFNRLPNRIAITIENGIATEVRIAKV